MTPKTLALDLLAALPDGKAPVAALIRAGELFDVSSNNLRVTLSRMRSDGLLSSPERGWWQLGAAAHALNAEKAAWRHRLDRLRAWDGAHWITVVGRAPETVCRLLGLQSLRPGMLVRPDNLAGGLEAFAERLARLGVEDPAIRAELGDLDDEARGLWDTDHLDETCRRLCRRLDDSARDIPSRSVDAAARETFSLGSEAIRAILGDPLLPSPLVDGAARAELVRATKRYDDLGRAVWRDFLGVSL